MVRQHKPGRVRKGGSPRSFSHSRKLVKPCFNWRFVASLTNQERVALLIKVRPTVEQKLYTTFFERFNCSRNSFYKGLAKVTLQAESESLLSQRQLVHGPPVLCLDVRKSAAPPRPPVQFKMVPARAGRPICAPTRPTSHKFSRSCF